jgi:glycyl-tRNA synthetase
MLDNSHENEKVSKFTLEEIAAFCKRKGFVYEGSEIYGGMAGLYDYGPYGSLLADNIRSEWKKAMVEMEDNIVALDSAIFTRPEVWVASGHVGGFSDPLVECKECNTRSRADHLLEDAGATADEKMSDEEINKIFQDNISKIKCPKCGKSNFTDVRKFNLLVKSNLGNFAGNWTENPTYLRGETCQGIYLNFKNVLQSTRVKVPFGIAQIGKAFRNEISPRQYIFRRREFEQMEMQYFVHPSTEMENYEVWKQRRMDYYVNYLKINPKNLRFKEHENLVFYAKAAFDIEYNFSFGFKELEGIHARGNYDLTQHQKGSGQELVYVDGGTGEKFVPHIVETSVGLDRTFLAVITEFLDKDDLGGEERVVVRFPKNLAPVKAAILPLVKNKEEITNFAEKVFNDLKKFGKIEYDETGTIGKRYRRQDEIGTPICVTVDFDGLVDNTVTVRDRDTGEQKRLKVEELKKYIFGE